MSRVLRATASSAAALAALGAVSTGYALWEARQYTLRRVDVVRPGAGTAPGRPLRILHLSDLHLAPRDTDRIEWVRGLAAEQADLTVITGDLLGDLDAPVLALRALEPHLVRPGLYVRGSNDYFAAKPINPVKYFAGPSRTPTRRPQIDLAPLTDGFSAAGWVDLDNARAALTVAGWSIDSRGVDDPHIRLDRYPDVAGPFDTTADLRLGVVHAPYRRILDPMAQDGADLILAGHTHGGQVCLPWAGALVTNCDLPRWQASGLSTWGTAQLHVSAGLGTNPYAPIRVACRPEATLISVT